MSLGFLITMVITIPCGRWNLDDNMVIQSAAFALTIACWSVWVAVSVDAVEPGGWSLDAVNGDEATGSQAAVLGTVLFNFGFVTTVPSWINEKRPRVSANWSLWSSSWLC